MKQMSETFSQHWVEEILAFAETQRIAKDVVAAMKDSLSDNPSKKKVISLVKSFSAVVSYLLVLFLIYSYNINYKVFVDLM